MEIEIPEVQEIPVGVAAVFKHPSTNSDFAEEYDGSAGYMIADGGWQKVLYRGGHGWNFVE